MLVGICDDNNNDAQYIKALCDEYFTNGNEIKYAFFTAGEEVLEYVENEKNERIDLLFLDIEMGGVSGITVKDKVVKSDKIWRIVFVTGVDQKDVDAFGLKVIGYVPKPASKERINIYLRNVEKDIEKDIYFPAEKFDKNIPKDVLIEDVLYFRAERSYTRIYTRDSRLGDCLITKKIKQVEELLKDYPFVRVHKSYVVNMMNIKAIKTRIEIKDVDECIPVGKMYTKDANDTYNEYIKSKVRRIV